jgi:hypothetical protein
MFNEKNQVRLLNFQEFMGTSKNDKFVFINHREHRKKRPQITQMIAR